MSIVHPVENGGYSAGIISVPASGEWSGPGPRKRLSAARGCAGVAQGGASALGKCGHCGGSLDPGFLICEALADGPKWSLRPSKLGIGGDELLKPNALGIVNIEAGRCTKCRSVSFRY
jgi:hypothetical protein